MILAAENKKFVTYAELNKLSGVSIEDLRDFAGLIGDFCHYNGLPYLNSLLINSTDGRPGDDYFEWLDKPISEWGVQIARCFSEFHLSMSNKKRFINTSGMNESINDFLRDE